MKKFKIYVKSGIFNYWAYFWYKVENGIQMTKTCDNSWAEWEVGGIPDGAILC